MSAFIASRNAKSSPVASGGAPLVDAHTFCADVPRRGQVARAAFAVGERDRDVLAVGERGIARDVVHVLARHRVAVVDEHERHRRRSATTPSGRYTMYVRFRLPAMIVRFVVPRMPVRMPQFAGTCGPSVARVAAAAAGHRR